MTNRAVALDTVVMVRFAGVLAMSVAILDLACSGSSHEDLPGGVKRVTLTGSGTGDGDGWNITRGTLADDDADFKLRATMVVSLSPSRPGVDFCFVGFSQSVQDIPVKPCDAWMAAEAGGNATGFQNVDRGFLLRDSTSTVAKVRILTLAVDDGCKTIVFDIIKL